GSRIARFECGMTFSTFSWAASWGACSEAAATMPAAMIDLSPSLTVIGCLHFDGFDNAFWGVVPGLTRGQAGPRMLTRDGPAVHRLGVRKIEAGFLPCFSRTTPALHCNRHRAVMQLSIR